MDVLAKVKIMCGVPTSDTSKNDLFSLLIEQSEKEFLQYTNLKEMPNAVENIITDMVVVKYNLNGSEGIATQSFSGVSEAIGNYPPQLLKSMNRYRRVVTL